MCRRQKIANRLIFGEDVDKGMHLTFFGPPWSLCYIYFVPVKSYEISGATPILLSYTRHIIK